MQIWLPIINQEQCTACGLCMTHCPNKVIQLVNELPDFNKPDSCSYCGLCEEICPAGAVSLVYEFTVE
jgi:NAD-dependent dihydropyrimidine dehydrogenase PreA subunit